MSREFCPGYPGPLGVFKKFVQKKGRAHFSGARGPPQFLKKSSENAGGK